MGWKCVSLIRNQDSNYRFAVVPDNWYVPSTGAQTTLFYTGGYRETDQAVGSAVFEDTLAKLRVIEVSPITLRGWYGSYENYNNVNDFIYGKTPGTCINIALTFNNPGYGGSLTENTYKYTSPGTLARIYNVATGLGPASSVPLVTDQIRCYVLFANEEEQKIHLGVLSGNFRWYSAIGNPHYYDQVSINIMFFNDPNNPAQNLWNIFHDSIPDESGEVYPDDDYTEHIGGDGGYDNHSDVIDTSPIPIAAATRSGMITAFVPTWGEIQDVASALLDPNIFQILSSTVVKPSDVIIGLSTFPCTIPANSTATVSANFLGINIGTGIVAHVADNQYVEINCGNLTIDEYWGNCLDYNPYTQISIFLPFCGMYELDPDEIMRKTINVSYRIDIFSGACLATIKINGSVYYQYTGQCSAQIPLNSVSFDNFLASMIDLGVATATGAGAIKGASAAVAEAENNFREAKASEIKEATDEYFEAKNNYTKVKEDSGAKIFGASVNSVVSGKGFYAHAGAVGGSPGFLAVRTPFLIIKRPEQVIPSMYGKFHGYPSNTTARLSVLWGYTEISDIRLNIPDATIDEIIETEQLLKGGVVL